VIGVYFFDSCSKNSDPCSETHGKFALRKPEIKKIESYVVLIGTKSRLCALGTVIMKQLQLFFHLGSVFFASWGKSNACSNLRSFGKNFRLRQWCSKWAKSPPGGDFMH